MLSKTSIAALSKAAGVDVKVLTEAISDEAEKEITIDVSKTFTSSEWETYEQQIDLEKKGKYDEGKTVGQEQSIKDLKTETGLTFEGKKPADFITNFKSKVLSDADKNPDSRIKELEADVTDLRDVQLVAANKKLEQANSKMVDMKITGKLKTFLPDTLPTGITADDALSIVRNNFKFGFDDNGNEVVHKGEDVLKNKSRKNQSFKDVVTNFATEREWMTNEGGRGGGGAGTSNTSHTSHKSIRSMTDMNAYFEKNNISEMGEQARAMINEATQDARKNKEEFVH